MVPPRVHAFLWRLIKNKLPTRVNLRRRSIKLGVYSIQCPFYDVKEENLEHVLICCPRVEGIWKGCCNWLHIRTALPKCDNMHFSQHVLFYVNQLVNARCILVVITWVLWN